MKLKNLMTNVLLLVFAGLTSFVCVSCDEEDPFVDRTVSPLLIVFDDVPGYLAGGGLTAIPSVTKNVTADNYTDGVTLSASLYELDKSGILDHTVGIDSIPASNVAIVFSKRDGSAPIEVISGADGKIIISTTWEALGITDVAEIVASEGARTITIPLTWSGSYKGQVFARYSQLVFVKE